MTESREIPSFLSEAYYIGEKKSDCLTNYSYRIKYPGITGKSSSQMDPSMIKIVNFKEKSFKTTLSESLEIKNCTMTTSLIWLIFHIGQSAMIIL